MRFEGSRDDVFVARVGQAKLSATSQLEVFNHGLRERRLHGLYRLHPSRLRIIEIALSRHLNYGCFGLVQNGSDQRMRKKSASARDSSKLRRQTLTGVQASMEGCVTVGKHGSDQVRITADEFVKGPRTLTIALRLVAEHVIGLDTAMSSYRSVRHCLLLEQLD